MKLPTTIVVAALLVAFVSNVVPRSAEATVSTLWTEQVCPGDGTVSARLTWGPLDAYAVDQWLDLAWDDPFTQAGLQQTSNPLSPGTNSIDWRGLTPNTTYYARVTQRYAANLISTSPNFTFKSAVCSSTRPGEIVSTRNLEATPSTSTAPKPQGTPMPARPENTPPGETTPVPETTQNCDHVSYPDICVPAGPPYLTCSDIADRNFRVRPPDPHRFDADGNGIGCEEVRGPILGR